MILIRRSSIKRDGSIQACSLLIKHRDKYSAPLKTRRDPSYGVTKEKNKKEGGKNNPRNKETENRRRRIDADKKDEKGRTV